MSLPRFFLDDQVLAAEGGEVFPLRLSRDDAHHFRVLRLRAGEHIAVVDATADYFECEIADASDEFPLVRIAARSDAPRTRPQVVLCAGLSKGDKLDDVIRHATELGVAGFIPLACERSVVKLDAARAGKRLARWRSIAKSAAMQSGQPAVPEVSPVMSAGEAAEALADATAVLVCWEEAPQDARIAPALADAMARCLCGPLDARVAVVVGPEGGLAASEVEAFLSCKRAYPVSLGPSILRTETAGIVAPALVLYELERA